MYRGTEFHFRRPKVRLEIAVDDRCAESDVAEIARVVFTGDSAQACDDAVFMMPLDACIPSINGPRATPTLNGRHFFVARDTPRPAICKRQGVYLER